MEKMDLLNQLSEMASKNIINKEEILAAFEKGRPHSLHSARSERKIGVAEILYGIGGAIVFIGISLFIGMNWSLLSDSTKIISTLGSGLAIYAAGVLLSRSDKLEGVINAFFFISALVTPVGLAVTLDIAQYKLYDHGTQSFMSGLLVAFYLASFFLFRKNVFSLFSIIYGTWFFFQFTDFLVGTNPLFKDWQFSAYRTIGMGLAYILLGLSFRDTDQKPLTGALYGFGVFAFLGAAFALGEWSPHQNVFWELIFPGIAFGILFLSIYLKAKSFLVFGSGYLMIYILKITAEYFKDGLGWPLALILAGFLLIAVGYGTFRINQKYLLSS